MPNWSLLSSSCDTLTRHDPNATRSGLSGATVGITDGGNCAKSGSGDGQTSSSSMRIVYGVVVPGASPVTSTRA